MLPVLQVGSLAIQVQGLILLAGVWVATLAVDRQARGRGQLGPVLGNLIFYSLVAGIVGARLGYALRFPDAYLERPLDLVSLQLVGLDAAAGALAAGLAGWVYGRKQGLDLWAALDGLTPGLAVLALSVAVAHLASGDAFGGPSDVPWAIELWGARRHPSQVYELIAAAAGLMLVRRLAGLRSFSGFLFLGCTAWFAATRLLLEAWRGDSVLALGNLRSAQVVSLVVLAIVLVALHLRAEKSSALGG